jgi:glycine oxidase
METPDFLVIGGGIIGCSLARELARVSKKVVVLDSGAVGGAASSAAAGLLPPHFGDTQGDPLTDLCYESADLYEPWVNELREDGAGDVGFQRHGLLDVWTEPAQAAQQRGWHLANLRPGRKVELLSGEELQRLEPALVRPLPGAVYYVDYAQVDPPLLMQGVARAAELAGVVLRPYKVIHRLEQEGDRVARVHTQTEVYQAGTVVLCAGAWTGTVAARIGLSLPTRPVKGQMLAAECRVSPVRVPTHGGTALLLPRADGRLSLGVTVEEAGFDTRVTLEGMRTILDATSALVPAVGQLQFQRAWAGLRPATPDGWPYMGPLLPLRNCWVSTGHFRKGILLAPISARLMARSIFAQKLDDALVPFKPTRRLPN